MSNRWEQFDGLRVFAILVIIASHTGTFGLYGQGSVIVGLFFVLSGFFMAMPMVDEGEERFIGIKGILKFYILRFVRIIPLYWCVLLFFYWMLDTAIPEIKSLLENMFLYNTYGHLWFLQHEMVCYLVAPFIMLAIYFIRKKFNVKNSYIGIATIVIGMIFTKICLNTDWFCLLWNGEKRQLRLGLFIIGMGFGYIAKQIRNNVVENKKTLLDCVEVFILLFISILTSARVLGMIRPEWSGYYIGWYRPISLALVCGVLLLLLLINRNGFVAVLFSSKWMKRIGNATFGIYLIHFFMIDLLTLAPMKEFVLVTIFSVLAAVALYENVEEPMYNFVKKKLKKW